MSIIPVTLLTGFLGSGKSTLLTKILTDPRFSETAVVVNEFGEIGLDGFLVEHSDDQIMEMTSGCLCCTIRGDIRETLLDLHTRREKGEISPFKRLVIETTGLADPAPVIHTLMGDPRLDRRYMLGGIITTIDALHGEATLEAHNECVKQVAVSDRIVITKTDMMSDPFSLKDVEALKSKLQNLNPGALVLDSNASEFDLIKLFDTSLYDPETKTMDVRKWLNAEAAADEHDHHHHSNSHDHAHHHGHDDAHDITRHGTDIRSFTLVIDDPVSIDTIGGALMALTATQGENLLRMKGVVNVSDRPGRPLVMHGVQHVFHDPIWLEEWPDDDMRTRLVFITRQLERATLEKFFNVWIDAEKGTWN